MPGSGCSGLPLQGGCSCCCCWPPLAGCEGGGASSSSEHSGDTASPAHTSDIGSDLARARLLSASLADACEAGTAQARERFGAAQARHPSSGTALC